MTEEFCLSDKFALAGRLTDQEIVYRESYVKEFIKILKEEADNQKNYGNGRMVSIDFILKLAGSKLTEVTG